jgi:hypothetical protein
MVVKYVFLVPCIPMSCMLHAHTTFTSTKYIFSSSPNKEKNLIHVARSTKNTDCRQREPDECHFWGTWAGSATMIHTYMGTPPRPDNAYSYVLGTPEWVFIGTLERSNTFAHGEELLQQHLPRFTLLRSSIFNCNRRLLEEKQSANCVENCSSCR